MVDQTDIGMKFIASGDNPEKNMLITAKRLEWIPTDSSTISMYTTMHLFQTDVLNTEIQPRYLMNYNDASDHNNSVYTLFNILDRQQR